jgi:hypothetical protein
MYAWMIIQWHISGYTQIIARYNRVLNRVAYRDFYDQLYVVIQQDPVFKDHFRELRAVVAEYLTNGQLPSEFVGGHAIHAFSFKFMFDNRHSAMKLAVDTLTDHWSGSNSLHLLQDSFIINFEQQYPYTIITDFNIETGQRIETSYQITQRMHNEDCKEDFYTLRRNGLIKNLLTIL